MSYGKHQSFYIKKGWITKGIRAVLENPNVFFSRDGFLELGIGRNMQQSLKFWLETCNILGRTANRTHELTPFGELINQYDLGGNKNLTKNLVHYFITYENIENNNENIQIIDKDDYASTFSWFFSKYRERFIDKGHAQSKIVEFTEGKVSENTLSRDIECLINMYSRYESDNPEDKNVSFLGDLGLIRKNSDDIFVRVRIKESKISLHAMYFILLINQHGGHLSLSNIINAENNIGKCFNLNRTEILSVIDKMISIGLDLSITRTAGLDTVRIAETDPFVFLRRAYESGENI